MQENPIKVLSKRKKEIDEYLTTLLSRTADEMRSHDDAQFTFSHLEKFVRSGKTIRGSLFLEVIARLQERTVPHKSDLAVAAAIELIHSVLLIQDDVMDQDDTRRGMKALHSQFVDEGKSLSYSDPHLYSVSALMAVADMGLFIAFAELAQADSKKIQTLFAYISHEYTQVGFAQWQDFRLSQEDHEQYELSDLESIHRYKTARYTFVVPVGVACILTGVSQQVQEKLESACEIIGMVFQMRDDYLSIFGDPTITGKPLGSDIIEDKKTFYQSYLFTAIDALPKEKQKKYSKIKAYFGKKDLTESEIFEVREALETLGVIEKIDEKVKKYKSEFSAKIVELQNDISDDFKNLLKQFFVFVSQREK